MRIDHREKKDDMEKDNIIADLKKNFKNIYESPEKEYIVRMGKNGKKTV